MEFKEKLKELRNKSNLTQEDLANMIYVSRSAIAKWESGLGMPNDDSIKALCEVFEINKEELIIDNEVENIIVEKNIKIKKSRKFIIILSFILGILLLIGSYFVIKTSIEKKKYQDLISKLYPSITNISLNYNGINEDYVQEVHKNNDRYIVFDNQDYYLYISINIDSRIIENYYLFKVKVEDLDLPYQLLSHKNDIVEVSSHLTENGATIYRNTYALKINFSNNSNLREIKLSECTYGRANDSLHAKKVEDNSEIIKISIQENDSYQLKFKVLNEVVYTYNFKKETGIYDNLRLEDLDLLKKHINEKYKDFIKKFNLEFDKWLVDGEQITSSKKFFKNTDVQAKFRMKDENIINNIDLQIYKNENVSLCKKYYVRFLLNGELYSNINYSLSSESDNIVIKDNTYIITKPGYSKIVVKYDLGFYESQMILEVDSSSINKIKPEILGCDLEDIYFQYNNTIDDYIIPEDVCNRLENYYNEQNKIFEEKTEYSRELIEIKKVDYGKYVPVFNTDFNEDLDLFTIKIKNIDYKLNDYPKDIKQVLYNNINMIITKNKYDVNIEEFDLIVNDNNVINDMYAKEIGTTSMNKYFVVKYNSCYYYYEIIVNVEVIE